MGICLNEVLHHLNAFIVVCDNHLHAVLFEQSFRTHVRFIFANNYFGNSIQQYALYIGQGDGVVYNVQLL